VRDEVPLGHLRQPGGGRPGVVVGDVDLGDVERREAVRPPPRPRQVGDRPLSIRGALGANRGADGAMLDGLLHELGLGGLGGPRGLGRPVPTPAVAVAHVSTSFIANASPSISSRVRRSVTATSSACPSASGSGTPARYPRSIIASRTSSAGRGNRSGNSL
jgi:hypothetical protein